MANLTFRRFAVNAGMILAVTATLAGIAYAAAPRGSVTSRSIRNDSIVSADVKNHSLQGVDIKPGSLNTTTPFSGAGIVDPVTSKHGAFSDDTGLDELGYVIDSTSTSTIDVAEGSAVRFLNRGGTRCFFAGTFTLTGA